MYSLVQEGEVQVLEAYDVLPQLEEHDVLGSLGGDDVLLVLSEVGLDHVFPEGD